MVGLTLQTVFCAMRRSNSRSKSYAFDVGSPKSAINSGKASLALRALDARRLIGLKTETMKLKKLLSWSIVRKVVAQAALSKLMIGN